VYSGESSSLDARLIGAVKSGCVGVFRSSGRKTVTFRMSRRWLRSSCCGSRRWLSESVHQPLQSTARPCRYPALSQRMEIVKREAENELLSGRPVFLAMLHLARFLSCVLLTRHGRDRGAGDWVCFQTPAVFSSAFPEVIDGAGCARKLAMTQLALITLNATQ